MESKLAKILFIASAVVIQISITTACSDTPDADNAPEPTQAVTPTPSPSALTDDIEDIFIEHICRCQAPTGEYASYNAVKPETINTQTARDTFTVGTPKMNGDFIFGWDSNPYDLSIKTLTGGYRDTFWITTDGQYRLNESVVCQLDTHLDDDGNKTYTFTIHSYLRWNNGEPITAIDYVAGILAYTSDAFAESGGKTTIGQGICDTELLGDFSFSVTISHEELPYFWEESLVTFPPVYSAGWFPGNDIVRDGNVTHFANPIDDDIARIAATERFAPTVTCGPYRFVSFEEGAVTLERNEYFGVCPEGYTPYFKYIVQKEIPDKQGEEMLISGEIDFLQNADIAVFDLLRENYEMSDETLGDFIRINEYPRAGYGFLEFVLDFGPTTDIDVRRALAHIIDRESLIESAFGGNALITDGPYSPAQWTYKTKQSELNSRTTPPVLDYMKANDLLDTTKWIYEADGKTPFDSNKAQPGGDYLRHNADGEVLRIVAATDSQKIGTALADTAQAAARQAGIDFTVEQVNFKTLLDHYYNGKTLPDEERRWNAFLLAFDFTPVDDKFWSYHSSLAETYLNTNGIADDELDRIVMSMRSLVSSQKNEHAELWLEFQVRWLQLLPALPLYVNTYYDGYNSVVTQVPTAAFAGYQDVIMHIAKFE